MTNQQNNHLTNDDNATDDHHNKSTNRQQSNHLKHQQNTTARIRPFQLNNNHHNSNSFNHFNNNWWKVCWFYDLHHHHHNNQHQRSTNQQSTLINSSLNDRDRKYFTLPNIRHSNDQKSKSLTKIMMNGNEEAPAKECSQSNQNHSNGTAATSVITTNDNNDHGVVNIENKQRSSPSSSSVSSSMILPQSSESEMKSDQILSNNPIINHNQQQKPEQMLLIRKSSKSMTTLPSFLTNNSIKMNTIHSKTDSRPTTTSTAASALFTLPRNRNQRPNNHNHQSIMNNSTSVLVGDSLNNGVAAAAGNVNGMICTFNQNNHHQYHRQQPKNQPQSNPFFMNQLIVANKIAQPLVNSWKNHMKFIQESTATILVNNQQRIIQFMAHYKGSSWREKQLKYQMPDLDHEQSNFNNNDHQQPNPDHQKYSNEFKFLRHKKRKALIKTELYQFQPSSQQQQQPQQLCHKCKKPIPNQTHCVKAIIPLMIESSTQSNQPNQRSRSSSSVANRYYHIDCFQCCECDQILVDLRGFVHVINTNNTNNDNDNNNNLKSLMKGIFKIYCGRHFVELFKPRCPQCQQLIFDDECTEAEGRAWHIGHFCCSECQRSLGAQQYIMAQSDSDRQKSVSSSVFNEQQPKKPYCLTCFDILFGDLCEECGELIGCETGAIVHDGRSWHADHRCFRCSLCMKNLLGQPFLPAMDGRIYCSIACSQAMQAHRKKRLKQNRIQQQQQLQQQSQNQLQQKQNPIKEVITRTTPQMSPKDDNNNSNENHSTRLQSSSSSTSSSASTTSTSTSSSFHMQFRHSQMVDYVEFIKKNNQCFTSKYDWSKEQEFIDVVEHSNIRNINDHSGSNNFDISSTTTATTTTTELSEDNEYLQHQQQQPKHQNLNEINVFDPNDLDQSSLMSQRFDSLSINQWKNASPASPPSLPLPPPQFYNLIPSNSDENSSNCSSITNLKKKSFTADSNSQKLSEISSIESSSIDNSRLTEKLTGDQQPKQSNNDETKTISSTTVHNHVKLNKSVSFDPNIEDKQQLNNNQKPRIRLKRIKSSHNHRRSYGKIKCQIKANDDDDQYDSCSSCSTCSSATSSSSTTSSDDDDDEDDRRFDLEFEKFLQTGQTNNDNHGKSLSNHNLNVNNHRNNDEACVIS